MDWQENESRRLFVGDFMGMKVGIIFNAIFVTIFIILLIGVCDYKEQCNREIAHVNDVCGRLLTTGNVTEYREVILKERGFLKLKIISHTMDDNTTTGSREFTWLLEATQCYENNHTAMVNESLHSCLILFIFLSGFAAFFGNTISWLPY